MLKYEGLVRDKIINYKFNEHSYLYKAFTRLIINNKKICRFLGNYDIIIPVPLSNKKLANRGYNQAELIANEIGESFKISLSRNNLVKVKETLTQSTLKGKERKENVKNAFEVKHKEEFAGKNVILFDDIYTTGSTVLECARLIKNAGANKIGVITIAKD